MKKKTLLMLAAVLAVTGTGAHAAPVERASAPLEIRNFEHYPSHSYDSVTGKWSVRANQADALLDRFWTYAVNNGVELCPFILELEGNAQTGVWTPVLRFYHMYGDDVNATGVSILVGDTRYDLAATTGEGTNGRYSCELISVPLTREAMAAVHAMIGADEVSVRLMGDTVHTVELDRDTTNSRKRVEAASLTGLDAALALLNEAGLDEYNLWDLSADAWESEYGFAPAFASSTVVKTIGGTTVKDDFGMVERNDQTNAAKTAQEILGEYGFLSGTANSVFNKAARDATRRAQKYLGMIVTGCFDAQLEQALQAGRTAVSEENAELQPLSDVAEIALNRYWFADGVSASNATGNAQTVLNSDNVYLVADGWIRSISAQELRLFTKLEARLVYADSYTYEATVACERNDGRELDMTMLPMAQSRLIVYAEIPAHLAQEEGAAWRIELSANGETLSYELK